MLKLAIRPTHGVQDVQTRLILEDLRQALFKIAGKSETDVNRVLTLEDMAAMGLVNEDTTPEKLYAPRDPGEAGMFSAPTASVSSASGLSIAVTGSGASRTATITVYPAGIYLVRASLSLSATVPEPFATPPSVSGANDWWKYTNTSGVATIELQHAGAPITYYLWAVLGTGRGAVSAAIAFT